MTPQNPYAPYANRRMLRAAIRGCRLALEFLDADDNSKKYFRDDGSYVRAFMLTELQRLQLQLVQTRRWWHVLTDWYVFTWRM